MQENYFPPTHHPSLGSWQISQLSLFGFLLMKVQCRHVQPVIVTLSVSMSTSSPSSIGLGDGAENKKKLLTLINLLHQNFWEWKFHGFLVKTAFLFFFVAISLIFDYGDNKLRHYIFLVHFNVAVVLKSSTIRFTINVIMTSSMQAS